MTDTLPICEQLQKSHPELVLCESNENLLSELMTNFSDGDMEAAFQQLASADSLALKATAQMLQEAEWERARLARGQKHADNDYKRRLRDPNLSREDANKELRRLRKQEQATKTEEQKALESMTPAELRAKLRQEDEAKGYVRPIRHGSEAEEIW